ncbi:nuclear transport factor 2 family protein [Sphaerisporangium sp. TRM90804]|uniref:YybH family protein n=1 Tax=Sphaerisporangium sp. TRM90804 TaxID=3031113 RepID=UPI00244ABD3D|nr:nuclear transport factor 2 family protein [Sphaerisporangium sp. TRM90804]MDH2425352.1 nuclear transport factor 2 family protein [Sphaerisporangium sp. TRM90804]
MSTTPEEEVRATFEEWFRDSSAKDLDAAMSKIADDAVSYEHGIPLVYTGVPAIREVCREGFELMTGDFRWDIPDLQVIVRGDIAVTWGLNHMRAQEPGGRTVESWSRGTRVFQKIDGEWKMIHQHVSYPFDPATGQARTDLRPEPAGAQQFL